MKKIVLIWGVACCLLGLMACKRTQTDQQAAAELKEGPKIELLEKSFDFGKINEGDKVEHSFAFKNVGNAPLQVTDVQVQCGCTVASKPIGAVAVGQVDTIKVSFNSEGKPGMNRKFVKIISNATVQPDPIEFSAEVLPKKTK